jgi:orotate phosphoribosyltransferase
MKNIDDLANQALELKKKGLSDKEIATDLHLSTNTVIWLSRGFKTVTEKPKDIKIGWKSIGVYSSRIDNLTNMMSDIIVEEIQSKNIDVDTIVGIAINGIPLATLISLTLDRELAVYRPHPTREDVSFSSNFASIKNKKVIIVDDVLSTGETMSKAIEDVQKSGGETVLGMAIVNKTGKDIINGVKVRSLIRAQLID